MAMDRMNVVIALLVFIIFWMLFMGRGLSYGSEMEEQRATANRARGMGRE